MNDIDPLPPQKRGDNFRRREKPTDELRNTWTAVHHSAQRHYRERLVDRAKMIGENRILVQYNKWFEPLAIQVLNDEQR
jgi:hypothetical protein